MEQSGEGRIQGKSIILGKVGGVYESRGRFTGKLMKLNCRGPSLAQAPPKAREEP